MLKGTPAARGLALARLSESAMADLFRTFSILAPSLAVTQRDFGEGFYESLDDFDGFRGHVLIAAHAFEGD